MTLRSCDLKSDSGFLRRIYILVQALALALQSPSLSLVFIYVFVHAQHIPFRGRYFALSFSTSSSWPSISTIKFLHFLLVLLLAFALHTPFLYFNFPLSCLSSSSSSLFPFHLHPNISSRLHPPPPSSLSQYFIASFSSQSSSSSSSTSSAFSHRSNISPSLSRPRPSLSQYFLASFSLIFAFILIHISRIPSQAQYFSIFFSSSVSSSPFTFRLL